jgi:hypothetical protein
MPPRCVLVLDPAAPRRLIANAPAVLGASVHAIAVLGLGNAVPKVPALSEPVPVP